MTIIFQRLQEAKARQCHHSYNVIPKFYFKHPTGAGARATPVPDVSP